jgi:hypothetical protein
MANHTTQMMKAQPEKNSSVNQSMNAAMLRRKVGRANAANVANAGNDNSKVRSADKVSKPVTTDNDANQMGNTK